MKLFKTEALAQLRHNLEIAEAADARVLAKHQEHVVAVAQERRAWLKEVNKVARSDQKLGEYKPYWPSGASCPRSQAQPIRDAIAVVQAIADDTFQASIRGSIMEALKYRDRTATVC